ncbi:sulfurtransferase [Solemya pervernicosa gill symbiont]|uniref:Sulfurtransferase n=2 Tax=Gammaproteobacteria incertae sedis TaxID=118884 RepID=A0A1T2L3E5_9GAMM|nr:DUF2892 domain-containing protein [Candidatus Reidiella endopervernicosa]OOZ39623.1 sulfurtransferase [Solemya pervernicosa gill symbiont]QKQ25446.1 DUF2892 domain-containing protein [Candidatus Reidiella endopervernicosa]
MDSNRVVRIIAGTFIMLTLALGIEASPIFHNINWLWFTAFVGLNLFQSGFTKFCPLDNILWALGIKKPGVN